jgi:hypothetical protein
VKVAIATSAMAPSVIAIDEQARSTRRPPSIARAFHRRFDEAPNQQAENGEPLTPRSASTAPMIAAWSDGSCSSVQRDLLVARSPHRGLTRR